MCNKQIKCNMSSINNVKYFHDSFSQNLKWCNTSDFILTV